MCLAVPGQVKSIQGESPLKKVGKVNFGGVTRDVSLAYVPDAKVDDYVIVHVGFALSRIDKDEAESLIASIKEMEELGAQEDGG